MSNRQSRMNWLVLVLALGWMVQASAEEPKIVDKDSDGLIDIDNLDDLNEIRNNLTGTHLRGSNGGCPSNGCYGFELTRDLTFDTDGDGDIDANDWNSGRPWTPIQGAAANVPAEQNRFRAVFDGNGHAIRKLTLRRITNVRDYGLFGSVSSAYFRGLRLEDVDVNVQGDRNHQAGAFAGTVFAGSTLYYVTVNGDVISDSERAIGGLAGIVYDATVDNCSFDGEVAQLLTSAQPYPDVGGLFGQARYSLIQNSSARGLVSGAYVAGLVGTASTSGVARSFTNVELRATISGGGLLNRAIYGTSGVPAAYLGDPAYFTLEGLYAMGPVSTPTANGGGLIVQLETRDNVNAWLKQSYSRALITNTAQGNQWSNLVQFVNGPGVAVQDSYWVVDPAGSQLPSNSNVATGGQLLRDMACARLTMNDGCAVPTLFQNWTGGWDFGNNNELPARQLNVVHRWVSGDTPNASGDHESLSGTISKFPEESCPAPLMLHAKEKKSPYVFWSVKGEEQLETFSAKQGLVCKNVDQIDGVCLDYAVSYLCDETAAGGSVRWTARTSNDTPTTGTGDDERLPANPVCSVGSPIGIEALGDINMAFRRGPPRKLPYFSTSKGLACLNADGACKDYEVRLTCREISDR
jgi:hypothetical protein